jgi:hypothetical protein
MSKLDTRSTRLGSVLQYENYPEYGHCRQDVIVNETVAKAYVIGTVLGLVTATGKYKILEASAADGSQNFAGIYIGAPIGDNKQTIAATTDTLVTILYKGAAGVGRANLVFGDSVNTPTLLAAVYAQMDAKGIQTIAQPAQFGV